MLHPQDWSIERALQLYNIPNWGAGYFNISSKGHLVVHPYGQPGPVIDLMDVVDDIRERKLGFPCVVRFQDVLRSRVKQLNEMFRNAIAQHGYKGQYFGVYPSKVNQATKKLKAAGMEGAARLYHVHEGRQITDTRTVKDVVNEGARISAKLRKMGLGIEYLDVGGGLGVDYVGARSTSYVSSLNYTVDEYAADVVYTVQQICSNEGVPEPHIVSESGRALTAHHSCILMNVFGHIEFGENGAELADGLPVPVPEAPDTAIVREMREIVAGLTSKNSGETYNDAVAKKEQALTMFKLGILGLEERAAIEGLFLRL